MHKYSITWEDMEPVDDDQLDKSYEFKSGFLVQGFRYDLSEDMTRDEASAIHSEAIVNIEDLIECQDCSAYLSNKNGEWCDVAGLTVGKNRYEENNHIHTPEKNWVEIFVDVLDEYGCYEDNDGWWSSDFHTVDYRLGIDRRYSVHIEWDWTPEDMNLIDEEIALRNKNIKDMIAKLHPNL